MLWIAAWSSAMVECCACELARLSVRPDKCRSVRRPINETPAVWWKPPPVGPGKASKCDRSVTRAGDSSRPFFLHLKFLGKMNDPGHVRIDVVGRRVRDVLLDAAVFANPETDSPAFDLERDGAGAEPKSASAPRRPYSSFDRRRERRCRRSRAQRYEFFRCRRLPAPYQGDRFARRACLHDHLEFRVFT